MSRSSVTRAKSRFKCCISASLPTSPTLAWRTAAFKHTASVASPRAAEKPPLLITTLGDLHPILPGYIATERSLDTSQAFQDAAKRRSAAGEVGRLEDMEGIAAYSASRESRFMTGQGLVIDGGQSIFPG